MSDQYAVTGNRAEVPGRARRSSHEGKARAMNAADKPAPVDAFGVTLLGPHEATKEVPDRTGCAVLPANSATRSENGILPRTPSRPERHLRTASIRPDLSVISAAD